MVPLRPLVLAVVLAGAACADEPTRAAPPPPAGREIEALVTMDNLTARPGQTVRVTVAVRVPSPDLRVGSYTGRLRFDPRRLEYREEVALSGGLRVSNPAGAAGGEIRFAGAHAAGFDEPALYSASFTVRGAEYASAVSLVMEELSAARSLANLSPRLRIEPQVQRAAH